MSVIYVFLMSNILIFLQFIIFKLFSCQHKDKSSYYSYDS